MESEPKFEAASDESSAKTASTVESTTVVDELQLEHYDELARLALEEAERELAMQNLDASSASHQSQQAPL